MGGKRAKRKVGGCVMAVERMTSLTENTVECSHCSGLIEPIIKPRRHAVGLLDVSKAKCWGKILRRSYFTRVHRLSSLTGVVLYTAAGRHVRRCTLQQRTCLTR